MFNQQQHNDEAYKASIARWQARKPQPKHEPNEKNQKLVKVVGSVSAVVIVLTMIFGGHKEPPQQPANATPAATPAIEQQQVFIAEQKPKEIERFYHPAYENNPSLRIAASVPMGATKAEVMRMDVFSNPKSINKSSGYREQWCYRGDGYFFCLYFTQDKLTGWN